jgi:Flp pilus assembly pilin Flp
MDELESSHTSSQRPRGTLNKASGASLVEYALLIGLVATIGILAIRSLGQTVSQQFSIATGIINGG